MSQPSLPTEVLNIPSATEDNASALTAPTAPNPQASVIFELKSRAGRVPQSTHCAHNKCLLFVKMTPVIIDVKEMTTILTCSLRSLFGELEHHSSRIKVSVVTDNDNDDKDAHQSKADLIVLCPAESTEAVQAALTMVSPPTYLEDTINQFDVVAILEAKKT
jgi:RNase P/RNase MRP subunit POP5